MSDEHRAQADRILAKLEANAGQWIPVWDLLAVSNSLSLSRRISDLRERGYQVQNELRDGRRSYYRLIKAPIQMELIA